MPDIEFRDPWFLAFALLAPVALWIASRGSGRVTYSELALVDVAPRSLRVRLAKLPALLVALAVTSLAIALAGPRTGDATTRVHREGIALALVVDVSGSMELIDLGDREQLTRLEVVKEVLQDFIARRPDDAIGLVSFAHYADGRSPLTLDHGSLQTIVADLEIPPEDEERGRTAIGDGLALACERLRGQEVPSKVVVLLTDGDNNAGAIQPLAAAELARKLDIKVHTVGVGGSGEAYLRRTDRVTGRQVIERVPRRMVAPLDARTLRAIADATGGLYFHAEDREGLEEIYRTIDEMERTEIHEERYMEYEEHFAVPTLTALALLACAGLSGGTLLRRLP